MVILEFCKQPGLEGVGIRHRELGHHIEGALGLFAHHAGDLLKLPIDGIPPAPVFRPHAVEIVGVHLVKGGGGHLVQGGHGKPGLADL